MAKLKTQAHKPDCMCDGCLKERTRQRVAARENAPRKGLKAAGKVVPIRPFVESRPLTADDLPFEALTWHLIVEPRMPKDRIGKAGLYVSQETKDVEQIQTTVGHIVHRGALFGMGKSASGVALNDDPTVANLKAGDFVLFGRYTGQAVKIRIGETEVRRVIVLTDTELMAKVTDPDRIQFWV